MNTASQLLGFFFFPLGVQECHTIPSTHTKGKGTISEVVHPTTIHTTKLSTRLIESEGTNSTHTMWKNAKSVNISANT